jgi:uncharacterized membrane protein
MQAPPDIHRSVEHVASGAVTSLTWGFRIAAALMATGVVISLVRGDALNSSLPEIHSMVDGVLELDGAAFIGLSIFAIILTPVVTTLTIALSFFRIGDRRYGACTLVVLAILAISIAWSQR